MIDWKPDTHQITFTLNVDGIPIEFRTEDPKYLDREVEELYEEILRENMFLNRAYQDAIELQEKKQSLAEGEISIEEIREEFPNADEIEAEIEEIINHTDGI
jgi:hypothetical protein